MPLYFYSSASHSQLESPSPLGIRDVSAQSHTHKQKHTHPQSPCGHGSEESGGLQGVMHVCLLYISVGFSVCVCIACLSSWDWASPTLELFESLYVLQMKEVRTLSVIATSKFTALLYTHGLETNLQLCKSCDH